MSVRVTYEEHKEIEHLSSQGYSNAEIAKKLGRTSQCVKNHLSDTQNMNVYKETYRLRYECNMKIYEIASIQHVCKFTIYYRLRKYREFLQKG